MDYFDGDARAVETDKRPVSCDTQHVASADYTDTTMLDAGYTQEWPSVPYMGGFARSGEGEETYSSSTQGPLSAWYPREPACASNNRSKYRIIKDFKKL
jgi:hypothetical protein